MVHFDWVQEESSSPVVQRLFSMSAVLSSANFVEMDSDYKDPGLHLSSMGTAFRVNPEDLNDPEIDIINHFKMDWAVNAAKYIDNACLGVTGDRSGLERPFTSINHASDHHYKFRFQREEEFYQVLEPFMEPNKNALSEDDPIAMVHPAFRSGMKALDLLKSDSSTGADTVMGVRIHWTLGARASESATQNPPGNPLMIAGNRLNLLVGMRGYPETRFKEPRPLGDLFDEELPPIDRFMIRMRIAFSALNPQNFRVGELKS